MKPKTLKLLSWVCIAALTVQFLAAGITKLLGAWSSRFTSWGYPVSLAYFIGLLEIVGVVSLFTSRARKWSALLLIGIMISAALTHIFAGEYVRVIHNGVIILLALYLMHKPQLPVQ